MCQGLTSFSLPARGSRAAALTAALLAVAAFHGAAWASSTISEEDARRFGGGHPWQGGPGTVNLYSLSKLTLVPIVGWTARGGLPVAFALYHSSVTECSNNAVGRNWLHSGDT